MTKKTDSPNEKIDALLAELWQRHLPLLRERLDILDRAAAAASAGTLADPSREEALSIAHKLSGNLGMFGYGQAGDIASKMEHILKAPTPRNLTRLSMLARELRATLAAQL